MVSPLATLIVCLFASFVSGEVFKKFGLPTVLGQIIGGIVLGLPLFKDFLFTSSSLEYVSFLSNLGIIFLLFLVGLEISYRKVKECSRDAVLIAFSSAVMPFVLGFVLMKALGYSTLTAVVFGGCLSVTGEAIKTKLFMDLEVLNTRVGVVSVAAAAMDDVVEISFLAIVTALAFGSSVMELAFIPVKLVLFVCITFLVFKALPKVMKSIERESEVGMFSSVLIFALTMALLSELLGLGVLIGALISGLMVQVTMGRKHEEEIVEVLKIVVFAFILPFFFVNLGLNFDVRAISANVSLIVLAIAAAISGKVLGSLIVTPFSSLNWKQSYIVGWAMNSRSAVELVIALFAYTYNLIPVEVFSALVVMAVVTTLLFPLMVSKEIGKNPSIMD